MANKSKILVVDDEEINRDILQDIFEDQYEIITASNGQEAIDKIVSDTEDISIVLLDIMMPIKTGFDVLDELYSIKLLEKIPVIVITGDDSSASVKRCFEYGVVDVINKPFDAAIAQLRVKNAVELYQNKNNLEKRVQEQTAELINRNEKLSQINEKTISLLAAVVEYRDIESGNHIQRIRSYTNVFAQKLMEAFPEFGLTQSDVKDITYASTLHDVGKVSIPDAILLKPGKLTDEEYNVMKNHTVNGANILEGMKDTWDEGLYKISHNIARHHHERYDGKGYPDKLKGDNIPIEAQIVAIADCYDALVSERPYKKPISNDEAFNMIQNGECGAFSPKVLECFKLVKDDFAKLSKSLGV